MNVAEEFISIQGEGKYLRTPSYFIRTTGCNLRCSWMNADESRTICDTPYTSFEPEKGYALDLERTIRAVRKSDVQPVVVTGGEPTLQPNLGQAVQRFIQEGYFVTLETNSTVYIHGIEQVFISASPKLQSSYAAQSRRLLKMHSRNNHFKASLRQWMQTNPYQVKFVINTEEDIHEILRLQEELHIPSKQIYLMPHGVDAETLRQRGSFVFDMCLKNRFNFTQRLHINFFGNTRGT
ncbi:7-carboxy-7-deazaguanine synthase QueE [Candidatus Woesearchaeota archaeon]|nr:7-carboxy-7-deazaguanine synthase QueE [Candidatus Woesearchaeota archaeon]